MIFPYQFLGDQGDCGNYALALQKILDLPLWGIFLKELDEDTWDLVHVFLFDKKKDLAHDISGTQSLKIFEERFAQTYPEQTFISCPISEQDLLDSGIPFNFTRIHLYFRLLKGSAWENTTKKISQVIIRKFAQFVPSYQKYLFFQRMLKFLKEETKNEY